MKNKKLLRGLSMADEKYILEADPRAAAEKSVARTQSKNYKNIRRICVLAASVTLLAAISLFLFLPLNRGGGISEYKDSPYYEIIKRLDAMNYKEDGPSNRFELLAEALRGVAANKDAAGADIAPTDDAMNESAAPDGGVGGTYEEVTDNQVEGVIEGDLFKRSSTHVFYLDGRYLRIYSIEGEQSRLVTKYEIKLSSRVTDPYYARAEIYLSEDCDTVTAIIPCYSRAEGVYTEIVSIDVSDVENVTQRSSVCLTGNYLSSRNTGGNILMTYTFTVSYDPDFSDESTFLPQIDTGSGMKSILPEKIIFPYNLTSRTYTVVVMLDEDTLEVKDEAAYLSFSEEIYVSEDTVYITRGYRDAVTEGDIRRGGDKTEILRLCYDENGFEMKNGIVVDGVIKDQYSLDQYEGILRVVTTTSNFEYKTTPYGEDNVMYEWEKDGSENAALYCIDLETMTVVASVTDFAPKGESVQSVRFEGDHAYVCTALVVTLTDPVFFFDLSDLNNITYTDTGDIDGYSSSLVNFGEGTLLGIGFGESRNSLKIEIYREEGEKVVPFCAYELPETTFSSDYKAYFIDRENGLVGLCVNTYDTKTHNWVTKYILLHFNGYELVEKVNMDFGSDYDATRAAYIDEYFYMFSHAEFAVLKPFDANK